jgi:phospholipid/cholesterol/gamma-HCH transport system substrate-binding protein
MNNRKLLHERGSGQALVGVFVLLAAAVFGWLLLGQGKSVGSFPITVGFNTLDNINEATVVKLRGFTIGQVSKIEFRQNPPTGEAYFLLTLAIEKGYGVPRGTVAEIRSSGLVGESYIHLDVSGAGVETLKSGGHVDGRDSPGMKQLIASVTDMANKLGGAGESISRADLGYKLGRMGDSVHRIAGDLDLVAAGADSVMLTAREVIAQMDPKIERVVGGLDRNLLQLEKTLGRTDSLVASTHGDIQGAVKALRQSVERLDIVLTRVDKLMSEKEADIDETLTNLHRASVSVREISEHPWKLITGQGKSDSTATP